MLPPLRPLLRIRCPTQRPRTLTTTSRSSQKWRPLPTLTDPSIETFRDLAFTPERPFSIPAPTALSTLPAIDEWFTYTPAPPKTNSGDNNATSQPESRSPNRPAALNLPYLHPHASTLVDLECTTPATFTRTLAPLSLLLRSTTLPPPSTLYLAQSSLLSLPPPLRADIPTPTLVSQAGKGDVYDTSLWIGVPPTYTPLHRDPNPNLFLQMAGGKRVRLLEPGVGGRVIGILRGGESGGGGVGTGMGEGMMVGEGRERGERVVWGDGVEGDGLEGEGWGYEVLLGRGDALFIPKGWWHSVKGVGEGVTGSVNWWFR